MMKDKNNKGWIKLHRSILEWEWWDDRNTRDIFIYCLLSAQHEGTKWKGITIGRGQLVVSLRQIAAKCKLSLREVRTAINHLISTHELTQQATHEYTLLTVCNYDYYQDDNTADDTIDDTADDTRPTHDRHTTDTHNKNDKNERNNINI
ncbi:MAG: hypothetical protein IJ760_01030, partial [Bacteroidales bacterium]|nr:hypothetical protein [Bacteroidales bacterium]